MNSQVPRPTIGDPATKQPATTEHPPTAKHPPTTEQPTTRHLAVERPAAVTGNDWTSLDVELNERFVPNRSISVVVPYYEAPEALQLTLAALEGQTYPRELFEVVVVDDGSKTPLAEPVGCPLNVKVVHQDDRGFGLARARNTGVRAAAHDIIVFLDCDMIPESGWLTEHARWHHAADDVLTIGFRAHVEVDGINADTIRERSGSLAKLFNDRPVQRPEWIEFHMVRTKDLTSDDDDLFRVVTGGNLGVSRSFFELVGGYDETFTQWGAEDTEFGYRAFTRGGLLVPVREAMCWHQGAGASPSQSESSSLELQRAKISQLIAHHGFRRALPGRSFTVPQYVVTVRPGTADETVQLSTVEQVLANQVHDLVVWIEEPTELDTGNQPNYERFHRLLAGDPRVRFGPPGGAAEAIPVAAFHITIPAGAIVDSNAVGWLRKKLGTAMKAELNLPDGSPVEIVQARFLHRIARNGYSSNGRGPDELEIASPSGTRAFRSTATTPDIRSTATSGSESPEPQTRPPLSQHDRLRRFRKLGRVCRHITRETQRIRSYTDARRLLNWFTSWVVRAATWRFRWVAWKLRQIKNKLRWTARRLRHSAKRLIHKLRHSAKSSTRRLIHKLRQVAVSFWMSPNKPEWLTTNCRSLLLSMRSIPTHITSGIIRDSRISRSNAKLRGDYRLGPEIATLGHNAESVFDASSRVTSVDSQQITPHSETMMTEAPAPTDTVSVNPRVEAIVVDTPDHANMLKINTNVAVVVLSELEPWCSVPAFNAERVNPVGWMLQHRASAASLGSPKYLPEPNKRQRAVKPHKYKKCRRYHHVKDVAAYHSDAKTRAGTLAALVASGAVVHITDEDPELSCYLGSDLYALMTDNRIVTADGHQREAFSIAMRRIALRDHSLRARARQVLTTTHMDGPPLPTVSILLATRRPHRLEDAIKAITTQTYPHIELVLAIHGTGFNRAAINRLINSVDHPCSVVPVASHHPLGTVLNKAVAASSGTLLTKFDDDDFYGPDHVWDLVLAHEYSHADLVGKGAEYVYLSGSDQTVHRFVGTGERQTPKASLAGGAMIIARHHLDSVLGWRQIPSGVDKALIEDVAANGGKIYRTHGMGYMLVRHTQEHTWQVDEAYFVDHAQEIRNGCDLHFAGIPNKETPVLGSSGGNVRG